MAHPCLVSLSIENKTVRWKGHFLPRMLCYKVYRIFFPSVDRSTVNVWHRTWEYFSSACHVNAWFEYWFWYIDEYIWKSLTSYRNVVDMTFHFLLLLQVRIKTENLILWRSWKQGTDRLNDCLWPYSSLCYCEK